MRQQRLSTIIVWKSVPNEFIHGVTETTVIRFLRKTNGQRP
jgi:hypothetical protein